MSGTPKPADDLRLLFELLIEETLSADQLAELERRINEDEEARWEYLRYMQVHSELRRHLDDNELVDAAPTDHHDRMPDDTTQDSALPKIELKPTALSRRSKRFDSIHPQRHKIRFNAMTAVLTALAWVGFSYFVWFSTTPDDSRPNTQGEDFNFVAYISGVYEHVWEEEMRPMAPNSSMAAGERLQLAGGMIEITFFDGAVVVLEAPAEFVIDSLGAGTLDRGKLTATVPQQAIGFRIDTPQASVVDLGTAFGVAVDDDGSSTVSVFEGRVETRHVGGHVHRLDVGQAMRFQHGQPNQNLTDEQMPQFVLTLPGHIQPLSAELIAYWAFDETSGSTAADTSGSAVTYDGTLTAFADPDAQWVPGKFGNALRFDDSNDVVLLNDAIVPLGAEWTVSAWFSTPLPDTGNEYHTLFRGHPSTAGYHPILARVTDNVLGTFGTEFYGSNPVYDLDSLDQTGWTHIAAVGNRGTTTFYINGLFVGTAGFQSTTNIFAIGNVPGNQRFSDMIDDVAIWNGILSAEEILSLSIGTVHLGAFSRPEQLHIEAGE